MHNQKITLKRVRPREQSNQIDPENKRIKLAPSISTTFFWDTATINITFRHLFGRGSEHYLGGTQLSDLRSLMAFGVCSSYANKLVCEYAKKLVPEFQKDFLLFNQEGFKTEDPEDGIKAFMIKNLQDNKSYLIQLSMKFQTKFAEFLANPALDQATQKALANNLGSLQSVLKTNKANGLLDAVLWDIFNILSDGDHIWQKKSLAICLTGEICKINCFVYTENKNQILIEIIKKTIDLLSHEQFPLVMNAINLLGALGQAGILKELPFETIERMILDAEKRIDHNNLQAITSSLRIIGLPIAGILKEFPFETKERILGKVERLLSHNNEHIMQNAMIVIGSLIQAGIFKELPLKTKERIVVKVESFLSHNNEHVMQKAIFIIDDLSQAGIFNELPFELTEKIIVKTTSLMDHNQDLMVRKALYILSQLVNTGIIKDLLLEVTERIIVKAGDLLDHNQKLIVNNHIGRVITGIGALVRAGFIKNLPFELIERIIVKIENLLSHNHESVVSTALLTIGYLLEAGMLNEYPDLIEQINIKAEGLLGNTQWQVIINAIFVMLLSNRISPETILNKITESQVNIIHKGILETTDMSKTAIVNIIKILTVLSKHESQTIQNMSLKLVSHIKSL